MVGQSGLRASLAIAVTLSLAMAGPVAGRDTGTIDETVTVRPVLSLAVDPIEIGYGSLEPGATSDAVTVTARISAPAGVPWTLAVEGSRLTEGDASMPARVRWIRVGPDGEWVRLDDRTVVATAHAGGDAVVTIGVRVVVPDDQAPGIYRGHLELSLSPAKP